MTLNTAFAVLAPCEDGAGCRYLVGLGPVDGSGQRWGTELIDAPGIGWVSAQGLPEALPEGSYSLWGSGWVTDRSGDGPLERIGVACEDEVTVGASPEPLTLMVVFYGRECEATLGLTTEGEHLASRVTCTRPEGAQVVERFGCLQALQTAALGLPFGVGTVKGADVRYEGLDGTHARVTFLFDRHDPVITAARFAAVGDDYEDGTDDGE